MALIDRHKGRVARNIRSRIAYGVAFEHLGVKVLSLASGETCDLATTRMISHAYHTHHPTIPLHRVHCNSGWPANLVLQTMWALRPGTMCCNCMTLRRLKSANIMRMPRKGNNVSLLIATMLQCGFVCNTVCRVSTSQLSKVLRCHVTGRRSPSRSQCAASVQSAASTDRVHACPPTAQHQFGKDDFEHWGKRQGCIPCVENSTIMKQCVLGVFAAGRYEQEQC